MTLKNFLTDLHHFLENEVLPISFALDTEETVLQKTYAQLTAMGSLGLLIPREYGGLGGTRDDWANYNILFSQFSGALLFLQAQHQFVISIFNKLLPNPKIESLFKTLTHEGLGIATAANRNLLTVKRDSQRFILSGHLRWVTGYRYFKRALLSFDYEGLVYYTLTPFSNQQRKQAAISCSDVIKTTVFSSTNNVSVTLHDWVILESDILATHPTRPTQPIEHPTIYNFAGATQALLALIQQSKYRDNANVITELNNLVRDWENYYAKIFAPIPNPLILRAEGQALAERAANLARISTGTSAILESNSVARISREIWQYAVAGYTEAQLDAYLISNQQS